MTTTAGPPAGHLVGPLPTDVPRTSRRVPTALVLVLVTGTGPLATDTYIAALPELGRSLRTSDAMAQVTMTACILGMAVGQIVVGTLSDALGRRRPVVAATVAYTLLSVVCATAQSIEVMVGARALQGFAVGAAAAVGRAVVNDVFEGRRAAAVYGTLTAAGLVTPVLGPAVGGVLLEVGDWRMVFWFLAAVGVAMVVGAVRGMPETLAPEERHPGGLENLRLRATDLVRDRAFMAPVVVQCLTFGGFLVYIGGSSLVLQEDLGISQAAYGRVFSVNALAMILGSVVYRASVMRVGPHRLRDAAFVLQTAAVGALFAVAVLHPQPSLTVVWACLATMTAGLGVYLPANSAIAQEAGRRYPGAAAALSGGLPFLVGALTTPLTGVLGQQTVVAMASGMAVFTAAAAMVAVLTRRWV